MKQSAAISFSLALMSAATPFALSQRTTPEPARQIELTSPLEYQVFQRSTKRMGAIEVRGSLSAPADELDVQTQGASLGGALDGKWQKTSLAANSRAFAVRIPTPSGGFYTVNVLARKHGQVVAATTVAHVGVGEVFVICGQSNSTNYGETRQVTTTRMVTSFDGARWIIADDPQRGVQDHSQKGSFLPPFGDELYRRYHVPIGIASTGHGSTSVRQWLPAGEDVKVMPSMTKFVTTRAGGTLVSDGTLFDGLMARIQRLGRHGFRAVLWHQGESDAHQQPGHNLSAQVYERMLAHIIETSRSRAGWDIPWFVAQATYHSPIDEQTPELRDAQSDLWRRHIALEGPDTDALISTYRQNNGKGVHLNDAGLKLHGHLWALRVEAYLDHILR